jgi:hypothetical protein
MKLPFGFSRKNFASGYCFCHTIEVVFEHPMIFFFGTWYATRRWSETLERAIFLKKKQRKGSDLRPSTDMVADLPGESHVFNF